MIETILWNDKFLLISQVFSINFHRNLESFSLILQFSHDSSSSRQIFTKISQETHRQYFENDWFGWNSLKQPSIFLLTPILNSLPMKIQETTLHNIRILFALQFRSNYWYLRGCRCSMLRILIFSFFFTSCIQNRVNIYINRTKTSTKRYFTK